MIADALGQLGHLFQIASFGPCDPSLKVPPGRLRRQFPGALYGQFELVCFCGLDVQVLDVQKPLLLFSCQVIRVLQPEELGLLQVPVLPGLCQAYAVDRIVQKLDDMEMVEDHYRCREGLLAASDERGLHVQTDQLDLARVQATFRRLDEAGEAFLSFPFSDMNDPTTFKVVEEGHVPVTFLNGELVYGQLVHVAQIDVLPRFVDVVLQYPPDGILIDVQVAGDAGHRHLVAQGQYHRLDVQRESRVRTGPGQFDLSHTVLGARCPRHAGMQERFVFEEVEMTPGTLVRIVDLAGRLTFGAREPCPSFEVDEDVQFLLYLVQLDIADEPWGLQPQGCLKELLVVHVER